MKKHEEKYAIDFELDEPDLEYCNLSSDPWELETVLNSLKATWLGPDGIHNLLLKNLKNYYG